uniref:Uncharacterized protein n=1 Tax=Anguilla anguilla TaxID=7936 RepID=A0A0E9VHL5_ANGAN
MENSTYIQPVFPVVY